MCYSPNLVSLMYVIINAHPHRHLQLFWGIRIFFRLSTVTVLVSSAFRITVVGAHLTWVPMGLEATRVLFDKLMLDDIHQLICAGHQGFYISAYLLWLPPNASLASFHSSFPLRESVLLNGVCSLSTPVACWCCSKPEAAGTGKGAVRAGLSTGISWIKHSDMVVSIPSSTLPPASVNFLSGLLRFLRTKEHSHHLSLMTPWICRSLLQHHDPRRRPDRTQRTVGLQSQIWNWI